MPDKKDIISRLCGKMTIDQRTGCWTLHEGSRPDAYRQLQVQGKRYTAHRLSAMAFLGYEPANDDRQINHKCDNRPCFNPEHLYIGTQADNMLDCSVRERRTNTLLNVSDVAQIRERFRSGEKQSTLANEFGVTIFNIGAVVLGKTWKHVAGDGRRMPRKVVPMDPTNSPGHERGDKRKAAKLTDSQVIEMRDIYGRREMTQRALATAYGISQPRVQLILTRQAWGHV